jgi:hypothetical protein
MTLVHALLIPILMAGCTQSHNPPAPRPDASPPGPSFSRDIVPVLDKQCAAAKGCHGDQPTDSVTLDLRPMVAYRQLVNQPAEMGKARLMRVLPGDPQASMLVHKLTGRVGPKEGKTMPIDPDTGAPVEPSPLPPNFIDGALIPWIAAGAREN